MRDRAAQPRQGERSESPSCRSVGSRVALAPLQPCPELRCVPRAPLLPAGHTWGTAAGAAAERSSRMPEVPPLALLPAQRNPGLRLSHPKACCSPWHTDTAPPALRSRCFGCGREKQPLRRDALAAALSHTNTTWCRRQARTGRRVLARPPRVTHTFRGEGHLTAEGTPALSTRYLSHLLQEPTRSWTSRGHIALKTSAPSPLTAGSGRLGWTSPPSSTERSASVVFCSKHFTPRARLSGAQTYAAQNRHRP